MLSGVALVRQSPFLDSSFLDLLPFVDDVPLKPN